MLSVIDQQSGLEIINTNQYLLPLLVPFDGTEVATISSRRFSIEISISYNQNAFDTLILPIIGSPAFNGYEVC